VSGTYTAWDHQRGYSSQEARLCRAGSPCEGGWVRRRA